jgi:hypothetical protein
MPRKKKEPPKFDPNAEYEIGKENKDYDEGLTTEQKRILSKQMPTVTMTNPWTMADDSRKLYDGMDTEKFKFITNKAEIVLPPKLDELKYIIADVMAGDPEAAKRPEFTNLNLDAVMKAINWLISTDAVSDSTRNMLIQDPSLLAFKRRPPTADDILSEKWIGAMAESLHDHLKNTFRNFWDPINPYRTWVMSESIGSGKSTRLILSFLMESAHFALMRSPHSFFGLAPSTIFCSVLCAATKAKASELLFEPFLQVLEQAPFFRKVRTHTDMLKEEEHFISSGEADFVPWTTSSPTSVVAFAGGNNYKIISSAGGLLGQNILIGGMTELTWMAEQPGWNEEKVYNFFSKLRGRISSRMKGNWYGRFILDSSPNTMEDPVTQWVYNDAPKSKLNYVCTGSRWKLFPKDFPDFMRKNDEGDYEETHDLSVAFPLFKGSTGKPPAVIEFESDLANYEEVDLAWCPRESKTANGIESYFDMAKEDPIIFEKDYVGIPSTATDRIFYLPDTIENCFDNDLRNIYASIRAPALDDPEHLIWNEVSSRFFHKVFDKYEYYYHPRAHRVLSVDQSESQDMASIAVSHLCFNPRRVDSKTGQPTVEMVTDFTVVINPKGGLVNLDAIKYFIMDLRSLGGLMLNHVSFDGFEARSTKQFLLRQNFTVDYVSVDRDTKPYLSWISQCFEGRWHCGRNVIVKNNMKSLYNAKRKSGSAKIEHVQGDLVYDWTGNWVTDRTGIYAKDATDAIAGNSALLETYGNEFPAVFEWSPETSAGRTPESVAKANAALLGKFHLS